MSKPQFHTDHQTAKAVDILKPSKEPGGIAVSRLTRLTVATITLIVIAALAGIGV